MFYIYNCFVVSSFFFFSLIFLFSFSSYTVLLFLNIPPLLLLLQCSSFPQYSSSRSSLTMFFFSLVLILPSCFYCLFSLSFSLSSPYPIFPHFINSPVSFSFSNPMLYLFSVCSFSCGPDTL